MQLNPPFLLFVLLLPLAGCAQPQQYAYNWDNLDYAGIYCAKNPDLCKEDEDDLSSIGRGRGGGKGR